MPDLEQLGRIVLHHHKIQTSGSLLLNLEEKIIGTIQSRLVCGNPVNQPFRRQRIVVKESHQSLFSQQFQSVTAGDLPGIHRNRQFCLYLFNERILGSRTDQHQMILLNLRFCDSCIRFGLQMPVKQVIMGDTVPAIPPVTHPRGSHTFTCGCRSTGHGFIGGWVAARPINNQQRCSR